MAEFITENEQESIRLAKKLSPLLKRGDIIAFYAPMGSGKTTFVRGLAQGLSLKGEVSSPTYSLVNEYRGDFSVYHFDMYRINTFEALESTGFFDYLDGISLLLIEWSEQIEAWLPPNIIKVEIIPLEESKRKFIVKGGARFENLSF